MVTFGLAVSVADAEYAPLAPTHITTVTTIKIVRSL
jgi:hypothetical protein